MAKKDFLYGIAALLASAVMGAGCDDSTPTSPTSGPFVNFANVTPDGLRRDMLGRPGDDLGLAGRYDITFTAAAACSELPLHLRSRALGVFSLDAFRWWLADQPIIERVGPDGFLAFVGTAQAPVITTPAAFTAAFDGSISFCSAMTPQTSDHFRPSCAAPVECRSDQHQIRFVRR